MLANAGHKAAFWGRTEVFDLLISHGLDINAKGGYNGYTALHDAISQNHIDVVKKLLAAGARTDIKGHDKKTAVDLAKQTGREASLKLLNEYHRWVRRQEYSGLDSCLFCV